MSNFIDTLDEIESRFLSNLHKVSVLVEILIELYNLTENYINEPHIGLINALKKPH